jgi:Ca2+-binding EF-hand superfamily protein
MESPAKPRRPDPDAKPKPDFFSLEMIRSIDRNHDGRIEKDEIPKILQAKILARLDRNQDELIDESEIDSLQPASTKE